MSLLPLLSSFRLQSHHNPPGKALAADPNNLEVLLSLGVSHANELEAGQALTYLATWLRAHPDHGPAASPTPPDSSQALAHVLRCFEGAVAAAPGVADLHMALGVLHHLGRSYDAAIKSFQRALELRPQVVGWGAV
jgi:peroxin-5